MPPQTQTPRVAVQLWGAAKPLLDEGKIDDARNLIVEAISVLVARNAELELLLKKFRAAGRGATSEKMSAEQLSLLEALLAQATPEGAEPNVEAEAAADAELDEEIEEAEATEQSGPSADATDGAGDVDKPKRRRNSVLRLENLPVRETVLPVPPDKADWRLIGYDETERLRYSPAHFYREVFKAPVVEAPELDDNGNTEIAKCTDAVPQTLQPGCIAGADVIAAILTNKYERHMPLHRMHRAVLADQGLHLPVSTLCDWAKLGGSACVRLAEALRSQVVGAWLVQTDATGLRVNDPRTGVYRGTIWCAIGRSDDMSAPANILFEFTETGEGEDGPWKMFANRTGPLMADANNIYDRVFNGRVASAMEVGCNAHALRKMKELLPEDPRAAYVVQLIRRAYRVETLAETQKLTADQRTALRQERTRPLFETKLKPYLQHLIQQTTPSDPLRKAAQYYLNHWAALTRFIDDGRLPLDNNAVESALRVVRLGENNYLFAGSTEAAKRLAAILTVIGTARSHRLNVMEYLTHVFTELPKLGKDDSVTHLLPEAVRAIGPPD